MFQFTGRIGFCMDVGDFLQLQSPFQSHSIVQAPAQEEGIFPVGIVVGIHLNLIHMVQDVMHPFRHFQDGLDQLVQPFIAQLAHQMGDVHGKQQHDNQLGGISFGGGHGDFRTGVGVYHLVGFPGDGGTHHVGHGHGPGPPPFSLLQGFQGIAGLAALAHHDAHAVFVDDRVPIPEFRSDVHFHRDPGHLFDVILAHDARMISRAAGYNEDLLQVLEGFCSPVQFTERDLVAVPAHPAPQGIPDRLGLFVDFLQHEVFEAALFSCFSIPVHPEHFLVDLLPVQVFDRHLVRFHNGHFPIAENVGVTGLVDDGRDIGSDVVLSLAQTDDQRVVLLGADQLAGVLGAQEHQGIGPLDGVQHLPDRAFKVPVPQVGHQMGHDFRIRFGQEMMTLLQQCLFQGHVVFDDPVMHHGKLAAFVHMGMGIDVAGFSVGGPPGVTDADGTHRFMAHDFLPQGVQTAHAFFHVDLAVVVNGDARRIIPSIFQFAQPFHQKRRGLMTSDVTNNTAHCVKFLLMCS